MVLYNSKKSFVKSENTEYIVKNKEWYNYIQARKYIKIIKWVVWKNYIAKRDRARLRECVSGRNIQIIESLFLGLTTTFAAMWIAMWQRDLWGL